MYGQYTSSDGYKFNDKESWACYMADSEDNPYCSASNYGGYKDDESTSERYEQDTSNYHSTFYQRFSKDPKYYHGPREEFDIIHETEKAYLLSNGVASFWCPKSLIIDVIRIRNSIAGRIWKGLNRQIIT